MPKPKDGSSDSSDDENFIQNLKRTKSRSRASVSDKSDMSSSLFSNRDLEYKKVPSSIMNSSRSSSHVSGNKKVSGAQSGAIPSTGNTGSHSSDLQDQIPAAGIPLRNEPSQPSGISAPQGKSCFFLLLITAFCINAKLPSTGQIFRLRKTADESDKVKKLSVPRK